MTAIRGGLILILALTTLLSACGFQLRGGERPLHKAFPHMHLVIDSNDTFFRQIMEQTLKDAGIQLNSASVNRLEILDARQQKRTASYSSRAKTAEYELIKTVTFRFLREKEEWITPMKLEARRSYLYRETAAVGKAEEETLLMQEMSRDLAQRILLALRHNAETEYEESAGAGQ